MRRSNNKTLSGGAWAELSLLAAILGGSLVVNRVALNDMPAATAVAIRVVGAGPPLCSAVGLGGGVARQRSLVTPLTASTAITVGAIVPGEALPLSACAGFGLITAGLIVRDGRLLARKDSA